MYTSREFRIFLIILAIIAIVIAANINGYILFEDRTSSENTSTISNDDIDTVYDEVSIDESFYDTGDMEPVVANANNISNVSSINVDGITAKAYLVGNIETGKIYLESKSNLTLPIASMSKLMTAYVARQVITPTTTIEISSDNIKVFADQSNLLEGEKFTFEETLYPLLLSSSNIASEAIATNFGRQKFLELMSGYAWEIGLPTSYFTDPSGLSPNNRASASGFFILAKYIYKNNKELLDITKKASVIVATTTEHGYHIFVSTHPFVKDPRFIGGKTGRTDEAGDTMLTILNIGGDPIAFIVLGSNYDKRRSDTDILVSKFENLTTSSR